MTALAWPFVALCLVAALAWLGRQVIAALGRKPAARLDAVEAEMKRLGDSQTALLASVRDELLPKLDALDGMDDRIGRVELEQGIGQ